MDEQDIAFLVAKAFDVGRSLQDFCDSNTSTDREFANFADDVNAFASAWSIIQPSLRDPSVALSPSLLRILGSISSDGTAILTRLRESITTLHSRYRKIGIAATKKVILRIGSHYKTQCRQLLIEFLGQQLVVLHRSQIIFATSTLNVILVVIHHARARPTRQHESLHTHNELHLLNEQQRARAKIETEEALFKDLQVRATLWLPRLPQKQTGRDSIFDILAEEWTQPALNAAQRGTNYDAELQRHIEHLARRLQEQEQRGRQADALIADLQRRDESNERRRQEDRNIIDRLESRLQEQEQQSRKDRALILQLQERCRQWSRHYNSKEGEMKRLQTQLDRLTHAYKEQRREMQQLQQVYQALKTENDKLRREKRALQHETYSLHLKNNDLLRENKTLRDENENTTRKKKVVEQQCEQQCERLERELARIKGERDSWLKYACKLRDRIATQSAMGPTSFPSKRSSRHDSYSSGGSSPTYVARSRESSKERRT